MVGLVGMGVQERAMDSDGVGRASETVCSRSGLAIVSLHGVGLESAPLSPVPLPLSNVVVVGMVACPAGSGSVSGSSLSRRVSLRRGYRVG